MRLCLMYFAVTAVWAANVTMNCPHLKFGDDCLNTCNCDSRGTRFCHDQTGKCFCKSGYKGTRCQSDINECAFKRPCEERFTYCKNTFGSYQCLCLTGFKPTATGLCAPCPFLKFGRNCAKTCKCKPENAFGCDKAVGTCLCAVGWEGATCEESVNDCLGNVCPGQTCSDEHRGYLCLCGKNRRVIDHKCEEFHTYFVTANSKPKVGEPISLFIFFELSGIYKYFPTAGPNFKYSLMENEKEHYCDVDFHHCAKRLTGYDSFPVELFRPYNYYCHFIIQLWHAKKIMLTAVPETAEYHEMHISFDTTLKTRPAKECLRHMKITGAQESFQKEPKLYKRQEYLRFEVKYKPTSECRETPRVRWTYYTVSDDFDWREKYCMDGMQFKELNSYPISSIKKLIHLSGEPAISHQEEAAEILPKNTLPLGQVLVCAASWVQKDMSTTIMICGVLRIVSSWSIEGSFRPKGVRFAWPNTVTFILKAFFWEPDFNSTLNYEWDFHNTENGTHTYLNGSDTFVLHRHSIKDGQRLHILTCTVRVKNYPSVFVVRTFNVTQRQAHKVFPIFLKCYAGCADIIGTNKDVYLYVDWAFGYYPGRVRKILYLWNLWENSKFVPIGKKRRLLQRKPRGYQMSSLRIKPGQLKPGTRYWIQIVVVNMDIVEKPFGSFTFQVDVEAPPKGDGCSITPLQGAAVFTQFTVTCKDYVDPVAGLPLLYRLYHWDKPAGADKYFYTLIAYSGSGVLKNIGLASPKGEGISEAKLRTDVISIRGTSVSTFLKVKLKTLDQRTTLDRFYNGSKLGEMSGGGQEDIRAVNNIATVISVDSTATLEKKCKVRKTLLQNLYGFSAQSAEKIQHTSVVLEKSVYKGDQIDPHGLKHGLGTVVKLTKYLGYVSNDNWLLTERVAKLQVDSIGKLLHVHANEGENATKYEPENAEERKASKQKHVHNSFMITHSLGNVAEVLTGNLKAAGETLKLQTDAVDLAVEWQNISSKSVFNFLTETGDVNFYVPSLQLGVLKDEGVESEFHTYRRNPYAWASGHLHGNLPVVRVNFVRQKTKHLITKKKQKTKKWRFSKPADIFINFNSSESERIDYATVIDVYTKGKTKYVKKSSCIFMSVEASTTEATVLKIESPDNLTLEVKGRYTNLISAFQHVSDEDSLDFPMEEEFSVNSSKGMLYRDPNLFFLPQLTKPQFKKGTPFYRVKVSVKLRQEFDPGDREPMKVTKKEGLTEESDSDQKGIDLYNITIHLTPYKMSCVHFDEQSQSFLSDECMLTMFSNLSQLHCRCVVAATFTGSILVVPKLINPLDVGLFLELFDNPLPVSMVIGIWIIFVAGWLWGRRKDKQDEIRRGASVLEDNQEDHSYIYLVCVSTGWSIRAETTSQVFIVLKGSWDQSETHLLQDNTRRLFQSGAEDWFLLATKDDLGEILSVVVWTDFSGGHPSWFLNSVYIQNMHTSEAWHCLFNSWISTRMGSRQLVVEIPAVKEAEYSRKWFIQIFVKTQNDIRNEHLWIGMVAKTFYNRFTRVRRLVTGMTMLQSLMILNLMFFGIRDADDAGQFTVVLGQKIHVTSVIIGFESSVAITAIGLLVASLFNRVSPKPESKSIEEFLLDAGNDDSNIGKASPLDEPSESSSEESVCGESSSDSSEDEVIKAPVKTKIKKSLISMQKNMVKEMNQGRKSGASSESTGSSISEINENESARVKKDGNRVVHISGSLSGKEKESSHDPANVGGKIRKGSAVDPSQLRGKIRKGSAVDPVQLNTTVIDIFNDDEYDDDEEEAEDEGKQPVHGEKRETETEPVYYMLPWWFIYITWTLVMGYNLFLAYYIMLYGLSLGYEKSVDWVLAFFTGFVFNIALVQPIKVIFMVFLLVLVFKQTHSLKEQAPIAKLQEGMKLLRKKQMFMKKYGSSRKRTVYRPPANNADADKLLERLKIEANAREILRDLCLYTLFMIAILLVAYGHLNVSDRYLQTQHVLSSYLGIDNLGQEDEESKLAEVNTVEGIYSYILNTLVDKVVHDETGYSLTHGFYLLGPARLRQVRVKPDTSGCDGVPDIIADLFNRSLCSLPIFFFREETSSFVDTWEVKSNISKEDMEDSPFVHWSAGELNTETFIGKHGIYSGGGYLVTLPRDDLVSAKTLLTRISQSDWIDIHTRCLFVEFTVYSPSSDLFTNVIVAFEMTNFGGVFPREYVSSAKLFREKKPQAWLQLAEGGAFILVLFYTVIELNAIRDRGVKAYFTNVWNVMEIMVICLSYITAGLYFLRFTAMRKVLTIFDRYGHGRFIDFQAVFYRQNEYHISSAFLGSLVILKMLKVVTFNPFMGTFIKSFQIGSDDFYGFSVITAIWLMSSAFSGMLIFGHQLYTYSSMDRTLLTLLFFILGEPDFDNLHEADPVFSLVYFSIVMITTQYIIINFFISILREGLELTRCMELKQENATARYMVDTVMMYLGLSPKNIHEKASG